MRHLRSVIRWLVLAACPTAVVHAASVPDVLFKNVAGAQALSPDDRRQIAALLPLAVGPAGLVDTGEACGRASHATVTLRDLNGDGQPEVIVSEGSGCLYGMRGAKTHFLARDARGRWREILTGDGDRYRIQPAAAGAWPVILPGVMGFCYPVYAYSETAKKYLLQGRVADPTMPDACQGYGH